MNGLALETGKNNELTRIGAIINGYETMGNGVGIFNNSNVRHDRHSSLKINIITRSAIKK